MSAPRWHPPSSPASGQAAEALFEKAFDGPPSGVWSAPGRANLIGEHVDYSGGICLPFALPQRTWVAVRPRSDGRISVVSDQPGERAWSGPLAGVGPGEPAGWAGYLAGVVWAMRADGLLPADFGGLDAAVHSDVPMGAGLSSSAALECALAVAVTELAARADAAGGGGAVGRADGDGGGRGAGRPGSPVRDRLVRACMRAENEIVGAMTGGMDQVVALHARRGYCLRLDCDSGAIDPVPLAMAEYGLALLVINTNAPHRLVDGQYARRRASVEHAAELLGLRTLRDAPPLPEALSRLAALGEDDPVLARRVRHTLTETARAARAADLLAAGAVREIGPLLSESHTSLRDDYEVSVLELDTAVRAAVEHGALGARLVGGGFGGSALALVEASEVDRVAAGVLLEATRLELAEPTFLRAEAGEAAG